MNSPTLAPSTPAPSLGRRSLRALAATGIAGAMVISINAGTASAAVESSALTAQTAQTATVAKAAKARAVKRPHVKYGDRNKHVLYLQQQLGVWPQSGWFGPITRAAVLRYKHRHPRLRQDAVVRAGMWKRLRQDAAKRPKSRTVLPVHDYRLTSRFGQCGPHWAACHTGLDFAAPTGRNVYSVRAGTIISAGWAGAYGNRLIVRHRNGTTTWYCHLSRFMRTRGAVGAGTHIAEVGATGNVTGPHLHFEVHPGGGRATAPGPWLGKLGVRV